MKSMSMMPFSTGGSRAIPKKGSIFIETRDILKFLKSVLVVSVLLGMVWVIYSYNSFRSEARLKSGLTLANTLHTVMKAVHGETQKYPSRLEEIGLSSAEKPPCGIYFNSEDVPVDLKQAVRFEFLPFNHGLSYQALITCPVADDDMRLIIVTEGKGVELKGSIKGFPTGDW